MAISSWSEGITQLFWMDLHIVANITTIPALIVWGWFGWGGVFWASQSLYSGKVTAIWSVRTEGITQLFWMDLLIIANITDIPASIPTRWWPVCGILFPGF